MSEPPTWLRPDIFTRAPGVAAGFSTRLGGVSAAPFGTLNLGLSTDDDRESVLENRRRLFGEVGFGLDELAITGQVHGDAVCVVDAAGLYRGFDGMVSTTPRLLLCLSAADCASVLLASADGRIVGACHAGWRGAAAGIVGKTVTRMAEQGARPGDLLAYVSPCISAERFEVGDEVADRFDDRFVIRAPGAKPHVDLKAVLLDQLVAAGVPDDAVEISPHCTHAETALFFSHRAENGVTGRMMGFIGIRG
ncbi:MAG: peptidoglycan editing factor PgeF [Rhodothermales bacterium]